ncbi:hypothetical protein CJD36_003670 [Flavipsychrobacter stenotrophus]|uniref:Uncharacterized protein n=1 Tax=Flavipsychrobacter stenotrophus TaxID=2077091 RepID=A0A2S7T0W8_9BACT|nr:hypothetical protein [Flavipsychrobacter stenotrophus]PQJ12853.1 hypothetical protein CJD36_003670 [Flavipsychrobacter stenotrophus]
MFPKTFFFLDAFLTTILLYANFTGLLQDIDLVVAIIAKLVTIFLTCVMLYKHKIHARQAITFIQSIFK